MKYLIAEAKNREEIEAYIEDYGDIVEIAPTKHGVAAIISTTETDAPFVSGRLMSGLMGGRMILDSSQAAHDELYDWLTEVA